MGTLGATEARVGTAIYIDKKLCEVLEYNHIKPGKGPAKVRIRVKFLKDGRVVEYTVGINETFEYTELEIHDMQYLYKEGEAYVFMNTESYEQVSLDATLLGDSAKLMLENQMMAVTFDKDVAIGIRLPSTVTLKVTQTASAVKGNTVNNATKEAVLETGLSVQVPMFVNEGEAVKIDTKTFKYMERA